MQYIYRINILLIESGYAQGLKAFGCNSKHVIMVIIRLVIKKFYTGSKFTVVNLCYKGDNMHYSSKYTIEAESPATRNIF